MMYHTSVAKQISEVQCEKAFNKHFDFEIKQNTSHFPEEIILKLTEASVGNGGGFGRFFFAAID